MGFGAASPRGRWLSSRSRPAVRRCEAPLLWTGQTEATLEIPEVPIDILYSEYADLSRMVEWSPSLESVVVDPDQPSNSVWTMRVPRALQAASRTVGYPNPELQWEAVLDAPGPPAMTWTSSMRSISENAGFIPSGAVSFAPAPDNPDASVMTLTLTYTLPDPVEWWLLAIITSPLVQGIVRNRIRAGMQRFASTIRAEQAVKARDSSPEREVASV